MNEPATIVRGVAIQSVETPETIAAQLPPMYKNRIVRHQEIDSLTREIAFSQNKDYRDTLSKRVQAIELYAQLTSR